MLNTIRARLRKTFDKDVRDLSVNSAWLSGANASKVLIGLVQTALVTRMLGSDSYGRVVMAMSVTQFVTLVFSVRVWEWVTKLLAEAKVQENGPRFGAVLKLGFGLSALVNAVVAFVVMAFASLICAFVFKHEELSGAVRIFAMTLLFTWTADTSLAALRVLGKLGLVARFTVFTSALRVMAIAIPLTLHQGIYGVLFGYVFSEAVSGIYLLYRVDQEARPYSGNESFWSSRISLLKDKRDEIQSLILVSFGVDTIKGVSINSDSFILGYFGTPSEVGYYRTAYNFIDVVNRVAAGFVQALFPQLAGMAASRESSALLRLIRRSSFLLLQLLVPGCIALTLLAPYLVRMVSGPDFDPASPVLQILSWSLLWIVSAWVGPACISVGKPRWLFGMVVVLSVLRLLSAFILVSMWGIRGMALSVVIWSAFNGIFAVAYYFRIREFTRDWQRPT